MKQRYKKPTAARMYFVTRDDLKYARWAAETAIEQIEDDEPVDEESDAAEYRRDAKNALRVGLRKIKRILGGRK